MIGSLPARRVATVITETLDIVPAMAGRTHRSGRPSKGDRHAFMTRVPMEVARDIIGSADANDVSYSELLAALAEIGLRHRDELPAHLQAKEVLPEAG